MLPKTILTPIGVTQTDDDVTMAISVCETVGGYLSILVLGSMPSPPVTAYGAAFTEIWVAEREEDIVRLSARAEVIRKIIRTAGVSGEVATEYCEIAQIGRIIGEYARYADLTIIGPQLLKHTDLKERCLNGALFESGRPVLIVPDGVAPTLHPKRVVIAWDGGVEAARALREALPILQGTKSVDVVMVDPLIDDGDARYEPGADIAAYLSRHGINVTLHQVPSGGRSVAEALDQHTRDLGAELLVMGAYGHSRLRERIFGGTTKSMICQPSIPILAAR